MQEIDFEGISSSLVRASAKQTVEILEAAARICNATPALAGEGSLATVMLTIATVMVARKK